MVSAAPAQIPSIAVVLQILPLPLWCPTSHPLRWRKSLQHPQEGEDAQQVPRPFLASASRALSICFSLFPLSVLLTLHGHTLLLPSLPLSLKGQVCRMWKKCLAQPRLCLLSCINSYSHKGVRLFLLHPAEASPYKGFAVLQEDKRQRYEPAEQICCLEQESAFL